MSLQSTIKQGIATARSVTLSLQNDVTITPWTGHDRTGAPSYGTAASFKALVEWKQKVFRALDGTDLVGETKVTILQPITANGAAGRVEPVDPRDKLTLGSGVVAGKILKVEGLVDPTIDYPYMFEIWVGGNRASG
jgi:hypothetical protein